MMLTNLGAERSTAATDLLLAAVALACLFGLVALAALLGTAVHGLALPAAVADLLWLPLNLALGLAVALFVAGAADDLWGRRAAGRALPVLATAGLGFFAATLLLPGTFLMFILYEAAGLLVALYAYGRLAALGRPGARQTMAGVCLTALAAAVQRSGLSVTMGWTLDANGLFHLVQAGVLPVLAAGLRASWLQRR